ncbi:MAG: hypothetical protein HPY76_10490 [Anaerolineae bacterium]|nr:hypothetical protein [Anaerolineae bacterium]
MSDIVTGTIETRCKQAKVASRALALAKREQKDAALRGMAAALQETAGAVLAAN